MRAVVSLQEPVPSDEDLVLRFQGGDTSAFDTLVRRYKNPVANFLFSLIHDYDRSLELAQETFLRVYQNVGRYEINAKFSTWVYRIGMNLAIDEMRRRKRWRFIPFVVRTEDGEFLEREQPDDDLDPEDRLLESEVQRVVRDAIATLPERYRASLVLKDLQGLSYQEIAEIHRVPEGTVKSRINRARLLLKERLTPYFTGRPGLMEAGSEGVEDTRTGSGDGCLHSAPPPAEPESE